MCKTCENVAWTSRQDVPCQNLPSLQRKYRLGGRALNTIVLHSKVVVAWLTRLIIVKQHTLDHRCYEKCWPDRQRANSAVLKRKRKRKQVSTANPGVQDASHIQVSCMVTPRTCVNLAVTKPSLYAPSAGDLQSHPCIASQNCSDAVSFRLQAFGGVQTALPGFYCIQLISVPKH